MPRCRRHRPPLMAAGGSKRNVSAGRRTARRGHRRSDDFVVTGTRPVIEAIRSGRATRVVAARGRHRTEGMNELVAEASRRGLEIETVDPPQLAALAMATGDHQGVAAVVSPPEELDDGALKSMSFDRDALVVVLDGITDPQNFGACARAAEAAGASVLIARK
ncbi:MAG TPA: RNA methyltransferase substrate-binding domain-containing protein, partial [Actinomycetota bacterium]